MLTYPKVCYTHIVNTIPNGLAVLPGPLMGILTLFGGLCVGWEGGREGGRQAGGGENDVERGRMLFSERESKRARREEKTTAWAPGSLFPPNNKRMV